MLLLPINGAYAQTSTLPEDFACRDCHSGSSRVLTFPSGEEKPIAIDLATLDESPHSSSNSEPAGCNDCHIGRERYRYPHDTNPAQNTQEFVAEVSENCTNCHYPHRPYHKYEEDDSEDVDLENVDSEGVDSESVDSENVDAALPVCGDCHGNHDIARVQDIPDVMPAKCLSCHTDQSQEWTSQFLQPRPSLGVGREGYTGSARCNGCHEDKYFKWQETVHAKFIQSATDSPGVILGDFDAAGTELPVGKDEVAYVIGNQWRQAYLREKTSDGTTGALTPTLELLPMQWLIDDSMWVPLQEGGDIPDDWITECGSCHVTGLDTETWGFAEFGVGCESCHGPGEEHASDPENVKPFAGVDDQVCGSCHSRGTSPDGYHFPASYEPGESLEEHFSFTTEDEYFWPDGSARSNHQQYMDLHNGNAMGAAATVNCTTCHLVHETGEEETQLREPLNGLCLECHNEQRALVQHTPFHQQALRTYSFLCTDCHMPKIVSDAYGTLDFDLHSHAFMQPNPSATIEHGGLDQMPNSCNKCHDELAESPAWAQETIAFSRQQAPSQSFFGPGPTPTSPPPPTPIASVGEAPEEIEIDPPFEWLRIAAFAFVGLVVIVAAGAIVLSIYRRRRSNV
jgi:predicted CXXCH cytochrome family protein